ncbi:MAG TPA: DUF1778 domain-containing protein [Pyrinomonadaceae bacterium]|jgi:uncharacterized protein (DUF1778 family)
MAGSRLKKVTTKNKDRLNFRLAPEIKNRVARAAAITGQELTAFAVSTLSEKANEVIKGHDELPLNSEEFQFFLRVLDEEREPSERSRASSERYRRGRRKGVKHQFDN